MVIYYISKDGVKELPVDKETKSTYRLKGYKGTPHRMMINKTELNKYAGSEMFGYVYSLDKNKFRFWRLGLYGQKIIFRVD